MAPIRAGVTGLAGCRYSESKCGYGAENPEKEKNRPHDGPEWPLRLGIMAVTSAVERLAHFVVIGRAGRTGESRHDLGNSHARHRRHGLAFPEILFTEMMARRCRRGHQFGDEPQLRGVQHLGRAAG